MAVLQILQYPVTLESQLSVSLMTSQTLAVERELAVVKMAMVQILQYLIILLSMLFLAPPKVAPLLEMVMTLEFVMTLTW